MSFSSFAVRKGVSPDLDGRYTCPMRPIVAALGQMVMAMAAGLALAKARERSEQERGGGSATGGSAREWRAGNWEGRRPEAPADGREREAVPSAGWREVVASLDAEEGAHHV